MANDPDTEFTVTTHVRNFINDRIKKLADSTNDYTVEKISKQIAEGMKAGESVDELRKRIESVYANATGKRAERIARTESIAVSNAAANEAYQQSPLVTYKEWAANPDACEFCLELDGKIVGLDSNFITQGQHLTGTEDGSLPINYEDIGFPPLHPNCRCTILPVAGE